MTPANFLLLTVFKKFLPSSPRGKKNQLFRISLDCFVTKKKVVSHALNSPKNMFGGVLNPFGPSYKPIHIFYTSKFSVFWPYLGLEKEFLNTVKSKKYAGVMSNNFVEHHFLP